MRNRPCGRKETFRDIDIERAAHSASGHVCTRLTPATQIVIWTSFVILRLVYITFIRPGVGYIDKRVAEGWIPFVLRMVEWFKAQDLRHPDPGSILGESRRLTGS